MPNADQTRAGSGAVQPIRYWAMVLATAMMIATSAMAGEGHVCVENTTIAELQEALAAGRTNASALARAYLARIEAYDKAGPQLNAVREANPDALAIAGQFDAMKPDKKRPLAGIPIL